MSALPPSAGDRCWASIGVEGDRSCPELRALVHCRNCPAHAAGGRELLDRPAPPGYLDGWLDRLAAPPGEDVEQGDALVVFRVSEEWLALPAAAVAEALEPRPVRRVPHRSSEAFPGLVNVAGALLPCCAPGALLGIPGATPGGAARLLVVDPGGGPWAMLVDEIRGIARVAAGALQPPPATSVLADGSTCIALAEVAGCRVAVLDPGRLSARLHEAIS